MFKRIILPATLSLAIIGAVVGLAFATNQEAISKGARTARVAESAPEPKSDLPGVSVTEPPVAASRPSAPAVARLPEPAAVPDVDGRTDVSRADDDDAHDEDRDDDDSDDDDDDKDDDDDHDDDRSEYERD